jgi:hypothetical protein
MGANQLHREDAARTAAKRNRLPQGASPSEKRNSAADLEARRLSQQAIRKYKLLERQMKAYGEDRGLSMLAQFGLDVLSKFRATWKDGPRTAGT